MDFVTATRRTAGAAWAPRPRAASMRSRTAATLRATCSASWGGSSGAKRAWYALPPCRPLPTGPSREAGNGVAKSLPGRHFHGPRGLHGDLDTLRRRSYKGARSRAGGTGQGGLADSGAKASVRRPGPIPSAPAGDDRWHRGPPAGTMGAEGPRCSVPQRAWQRGCAGRGVGVSPVSRPCSAWSCPYRGHARVGALGRQHTAGPAGGGRRRAVRDARQARSRCRA